MSSALELIPQVLPLAEGNTILDVGCGRGKWGYLLRIQWWCTKNGRPDTEPRYLIGADIFLPFLKTVRNHKVYDDVILCHAAYLPIKRKSFDSVLAAEIIEHIEKPLGSLLIDEAESVARRIVIITAPHFVRRRGGHFCPEGFNQYEQHVSSWSIQEFRSRGYRVYGVGFLILSILSTQLNALLSPLSFLVPRLSAHLIAVKKTLSTLD